MNHSERKEGDMTRCTPSDSNLSDKANGQTALQVNERIMCRSLFDISINLQQGNSIDKKQAGQRDRAPSRIPTTQLKHVMQKSISTNQFHNLQNCLHILIEEVALIGG